MTAPAGLEFAEARARWAAPTCWTGCGAGWASTTVRDRAASWPAAGWIRASSGCCSRWSPTGPWRRHQARRRRLDQPRRAHRRAARGRRRRLLPGDGLAASRSSRRWPRRSTTRSPTCSTSRWTCCSSTPPAPTSRLDEADEPRGPRRARARSLRRRRRPGDGGQGQAGFRTLRQAQGLPRRPAPGRDRHGRHPRRHPGAGVVLAGQHRRLRR